MAEKQKVVEGAMTEQDRELLQWVLRVGSILEEIEETAQAEQAETRKTGAEMRTEIEKQLHNLSSEQLIQVASFVGIPKEQIIEDLTGATTIAV
jgi:hypothetical protein